MFPIAGTTDLGEGVLRITTGKRVLGLMPMTVHCYRVGSTLIDAGSPKRAAEVVEMAGDGIGHVLLTHHHEDHVGAAARLAHHGATVHASTAAVPLLAAPPPKEPYQDRVWGPAEPVQAEPFDEVVETPDGTFEVLPVPGHAPDHVALFERARGWLFVGDAYRPPRETLRADEDLAGFVASLERIRGLGADRLFAGHSSRVDDPATALRELVDHFEHLRARTAELVGDGHDAGRVRRELIGREGTLKLYTGGHYCKQNLADQLVAWVQTTA